MNVATYAFTELNVHFLSLESPKVKKTLSLR